MAFKEFCIIWDKEIYILTQPTTRSRMKPDYDIDEVDGIDELRERMATADSDIADWSYILQDYIKFGNNKVSEKVAIFNMNSATDCTNRNTEHCQVPDGKCYAFKDENIWKDVLPYRRRQEYLWDCLDAETFADAFTELVSRKRNPATAIRFSESGDFRHRGDILKVNRISQLLDVSVYTYSASDYLDWSLAEDFTVNRSNNLDGWEKEGDRRFFAVPEETELSEETVWCPFDYYDGDLEERPQCGECQICINSEGPDVAIPLH